jgi:hypothetical protein
VNSPAHRSGPHRRGAVPAGLRARPPRRLSGRPRARGRSRRTR